jgi:hypothetical protein
MTRLMLAALLFTASAVPAFATCPQGQFSPTELRAREAAAAKQAASPPAKPPATMADRTSP